MHIFFILKEKITHFKESNIGIGNLVEDSLKNMLEELDLALEEDPPLTLKDGGFIKQEFSDELREMKWKSWSEWTNDINEWNGITWNEVTWHDMTLMNEWMKQSIEMNWNEWNE